jgi:hypothetical protein
MVGNHGWTVGQVARELVLRGVRPPKGNGTGRNQETGQWNKNTIRRLIRRRVYCGDQLWNGRSQSKRWELKWNAEEKEKQVVPVMVHGKRWRVHDQADVVLVKDAPCLVAIVDRDLWRRANDALLRNRKMTTPKPAGESAFLFTHLLVCAHCGGYMVGRTHHRNKSRQYLCSTYERQGKDACYANLVNEAEIEAKVREVLEREYLNPDKLQSLRRTMLEKLKALRGAGEVKRLQKQAAELDAKINRGTENLAILPADRIASVVAKVREWEGQRDKLRAQARQLEDGEAEIAQTVKLAEGHLWRLREALQSGDPARVRMVYRELLYKVELHFTHRQAGKITISRFTKGVIELNQGLGISCLEPFDG